MDKATRPIDVLIFDGMNLLDVAGPVQAFDTAPGYALRCVSADGGSARASCGMTMGADGVLGEGEAYDLLIPGGEGVDAVGGDGRVREVVAGWLGARPGGRLIAICSGALIAAGAGALDGRIATTHWSREAQARRDHPRVRWDTDRIFAHDGPVHSSAGVTAGIDLALSIIRKDRGAAAALRVARELVVGLRRTGGQSQFSEVLDAQFGAEDALAGLVDAIVSAPRTDWTLDRMAERAGTTPRTLTRRFAASFGISPVRYVERVRAHHARDFLTDGMAPAQAAWRAGFADAQRMRRAFGRQFGVTPAEYRARFTAGAP